MRKLGNLSITEAPSTGIKLVRSLYKLEVTLITNVLRRGLGYEGFNVAIAHSGTEDVEYLKQHQPDLIVLDIMLPRLNGLEVLRRARAVDSQLPILLLTARDTPADEVSGLARGADDYATKPFTFEVLLARIRALLRRHHADLCARLQSLSAQPQPFLPFHKPRFPALSSSYPSLFCFGPLSRSPRARMREATT